MFFPSQNKNLLYCCYAITAKICPVSIFAKNTNSLLPENPIGKPFFELSEVDSTNNYAMAQVQAQMAVHGTAWFAHYQNAGKGQRGKSWNGAPGQNILQSIVIDPFPFSTDNQFIINAVVALACFDFFDNYTKGETCIKWPNDIYWKDRKAGGILIENVLQGNEWKFSIVGIGININQTLFPSDLQNPVSLKQITGKTYHTIGLARELCECLESRWKQLHNNGQNDLLAEYQSHLYKLHESATFKKDDVVFTAIVAGVNNRGELLLNTGNETVAYAKIEWVLF